MSPEICSISPCCDDAQCDFERMSCKIHSEIFQRLRNCSKMRNCFKFMHQSIQPLLHAARIEPFGDPVKTVGSILCDCLLKSAQSIHAVTMLNITSVECLADSAFCTSRSREWCKFHCQTQGVSFNFKQNSSTTTQIRNPRSPDCESEL